MDICPIPLGKVLVMAAGLLWLASANFLAEVQARCVSVFHTQDGRQNMLCTSATNPAASQVLCAYPCPWLHPSLACYTPSLPSPSITQCRSCLLPHMLLWKLVLVRWCRTSCQYPCNVLYSMFMTVSAGLPVTVPAHGLCCKRLLFKHYNQPGPMWL